MSTALDVAKRWVGTREGNAALDDFLHNGGANLSASQYAWCSDFMKSVAKEAGVDASKATAMARSWLNVGTPTDKPNPGDVAVFSRGSDPSLGHVGFYAGTNPDGSIKVLSGNHNDAVAYGSYPQSRLLGFRSLEPSQEARGGSMNGGMGVSPTGAAGIAGPIHTANPVGPETLSGFSDFKPVTAPETQVAGADGMGMLDFNDANISDAIGKFGDWVGSYLSKMQPKPPSVDMAHARAPNVQISPNVVAALLQKRAKPGNRGGGGYGI